MWYPQTIIYIQTSRNRTTHQNRVTKTITHTVRVSAKHPFETGYFVYCTLAKWDLQSSVSAPVCSVGWRTRDVVELTRSLPTPAHLIQWTATRAFVLIQRRQQSDAPFRHARDTHFTHPQTQHSSNIAARADHPTSRSKFVGWWWDDLKLNKDEQSLSDLISHVR